MNNAPAFFISFHRNRAMIVRGRENRIDSLSK
jgi:hypothetical protein